MRLVTFLIAISLAAVELWAQPAQISLQESGRARQLLASDQWVDKAWGAYLAGRLHSDDLQQQLIEQFRNAIALRDMPSYTEEHVFLAVLFDALIEAGATVPANLLEPFEQNWTAPVLILSARSGDSEELLLRLGGENSRDVEWLAANNLLFERKSQRWYATIWREIGITHRFTVTDASDGRGYGGGGGVFSSGCGDGVAEMPKGFPPVTLYTLQDGAGRDSVVLAQGPENVYYRRTIVPTDKQVGFGSCVSGLNRGAIRIGYLAKLRVEPVERTERLLHSQTDIHYTSTEDFVRQVERSMKAQEQDIRALIQLLGNDGLHAPETHLRIVPEVNDNRRTAKDPLPMPESREIELH